MLLASDGGLHGTADEGASWTLQGSAYDGYNALQITEVTGQIVEGEKPHTDLYLGTQDNHVLASPDGGGTWPRRRCCEGFYLRTARRSTDHEGAKVSGVSCFGCGHFIGEPHLATHRTFPSQSAPGPEVSLDIPVPLQPGHYLQRVLFPGLFPGRSFFYLTIDGGESWDFRGDSEEQFMGRPLLGGAPEQPVLYFAVRRPGTALGVEGDRVRSLAVSGGVVRGLGPAGEGEAELPRLELRAAPGELGPFGALGRLAVERLSIRAVELDGQGGLRAVVAAGEELFTAGLVPPRLQILARDMTAGDPTVASDERVRGAG